MKRLDLYLLGEMLLPFVSGVLLIIVMLVGNTLYPLIEQIAKFNIPVLVIAKLVAFNLPTLLVLTLPAGMALSARVGRQPAGAGLGDHGHPHGRRPAPAPVPADLHPGPGGQSAGLLGR